MQNIFIHPGFSKSGTTTLQKIFNSLENFESISKPYIVPEYREFHNLLCGQKFPSNFSEIKNQFDVLNNSKKKNIIISNESINGAIHRYNEKIIEYLANLFPNAKIIFSIRNQGDAIKSHYLSHGIRMLNLPEPYSGIKIKFKNYFDFNLKNFRRSYFQVIDYNNFINLWEKYFTKENILILPLELMILDKHKYFDKLFNFLNYNNSKNYDLLTNIHANKSVPYSYYKYERIIKRIKKNLPFLSNFNLLKKLNTSLIKFFRSQKQIDFNLNNDQIKTVKEIYEKSNKILSDKYNLKLEKLGYF